MAFSAANLTSARRLKGNLTLWAYVSSDSLATIAGAGYFNSVASSMRVGDLIEAAGNAVPSLFTVSANTGSAVTVVQIATGGAGLDSPAFTGNPTAPTPAGDDNDTSIATSAFVQQEINDRVRAWSLEIIDPVVGRYTFKRAPGFAGTVLSLVHITNQGTVTCDVEIDGTDVTSLNGIGADSSETTTTATGANSFTSGQRIELNVTAVAGGPQRATFTLLYKRTGTG